MHSGPTTIKTQSIAFQGAAKVSESGVDAHYAPLFSWMLRSGQWAKLSQSEKAILITLRMRMNRTGETIAGAKRLATDTGMSRRSVFRAIDRLRQCGLIESAIDGCGDFETNHYRVIDAIPLVVAKERIGIIRVSIPPGVQTVFLEALKTTVATGVRVAKAANQDPAMVVFAHVSALAETALGAGLLSCAVVCPGGETVAVYRTNLFSANDAHSLAEHSRKQELERNHVVGSLNCIQGIRSASIKSIQSVLRDEVVEHVQTEMA
ncbi:MAG: helix-turn-helix domain-containing protein [Rhodocyclaceae bacterium]|nr:helix-turn-helix domain-containing protein [Rhodocyclaceae bacterium]